MTPNRPWPQFGSGPRIGRAILILAGILLLAGCRRTPVVIVENKSSLALSNVLVSGSGFTNRIAWLAPGTQHQLTVHPRGESSLRLGFDAAGRRVDASLDTYLEPDSGYRLRVTVDRDFNVSVRDDNGLRR